MLRNVDGNGCNVDGNGSRRIVFARQGFFARQTKCAVLNERLFDPNNGAVYVTFHRIIFVSEVFHSAIFPPVLERDEKSVFDEQFFGRLAAMLVEFFVGVLQNVSHEVEGFFVDSEESFELLVTECEGFLDAFGLDRHGRLRKNALDEQ